MGRLNADTADVAGPPAHQFERHHSPLNVKEHRRVHRHAPTKKESIMAKVKYTEALDGYYLNNAYNGNYLLCSRRVVRVTQDQPRQFILGFKTHWPKTPSDQIRFPNIHPSAFEHPLAVREPLIVRRRSGEAS
jgi:hypothetical protein